MNKDQWILIALEMDLPEILNLCKSNVQIDNWVCQNDHFWRNKLLKLGMKDVGQENVPDPKKAYEEIFNKMTNIESAVAQGYIYLAKYLSEKVSKEELNKLLDIASRHNHLEIVKYLINRGADIHINKDSPLRWASRFGYYELAKYLLENNANVHTENDYPVIWAARNGHLNVVKLLIKYGADINEALYSARHFEQTEIVEYLTSLKSL